MTLIPDLNRLRPVACDPFARPRDYTGLEPITLGYVASGAVTFGPYSFGTEKAGEIVALAATDVEQREDGRFFGRFCVGRAAGTLVDIPTSWGWTKVSGGTLGIVGEGFALERNVISEISKAVGAGGKWTGMRFVLFGGGPASLLSIGDLIYHQGGLGAKYNTKDWPYYAQFEASICAEVVDETADAATFSIYASSTGKWPFNAPPRKIDNVSIPKNGTLAATATGWGTTVQAFYISAYSATIERRQPATFVQEMQNQPFSVAVRNLAYLDPSVHFPNGLPWWGFIESCARASVLVARKSWPKGKAVRFSRHVGSTNAIGVCENGEAVTVKDFKAEDFKAADWLPLAGEDLPWDVRYPLVDITDMLVSCSGTAHPFIVPKCEFPVVALGEGPGRFLAVLAPMPDDAPWQVLSDSLGQTLIYIRGEKGAWQLVIEGTAAGDIWVPNWDTEQLERIRVVFDENATASLQFT